MRLLIVVVVLSIGSFCPAVAQAPVNTQKHEEWTKGVIQQFRGDLSSLDDNRNTKSVEDLTKLIDLHSKYEDYILKATQAQQPWVQSYGPILTSLGSALVSIIGAGVSIWNARNAHRNAVNK